MAIAVLSALRAVPAEPAAGTLCLSPVSEPAAVTCLPQPATGMRVPAAGGERRGVWIAADFSRIAILSIAPGQTVARVPADVASIRYRVSTRRLARGARSIDFTLSDEQGRAWRWTIPARVAGGTILVPDGVYRLEAVTPQARASAVSGLRIGTRKEVDAGLIELRPRLAIEGRLASRSGEPVANAELIAPEGHVLGTSASDGTFVIEEESEELPPFVMVRATGHAWHEIAVPDRRVSVDAGTIVLVPGATITVAVKFDDSSNGRSHEDVMVTVHRRSAAGPVLGRQRLRADFRAIFNDLPAGRHVLDVRGAEPLQRYGQLIDVESGVDAAHEVAISPVALSGHVFFGTEPLEGGSIEIAPRSNLWTARQTLGADGEFGGTMWQRGAFAAIVAGGALRTPFIDDTEVAGGEAAWDILIPDRRFSGLVTDARTGQPVAGAKVQYESIGARMRLSSFTKTDDAGRYEITGVPHGHLKFRASAPNYLPSDPIDVFVEESAASREIPFALQAGTLLTVRVVDGSGNPIRGAAVIHGTDHGGAWTSRSETSPAGEITVPVERDRAKRLYVIPREGSFATAALRATDSQPVMVTIPSGYGSLVITARAGEQVPLPNVRFLVRYNGDLLPDVFWSTVQHYQGFDLATDAAGVARHPRLPPGMYELWAYGPDAEGRAIARNVNASGPAARVGLSASEEQAVTLTFSKKNH